MKEKREHQLGQNSHKFDETSQSAFSTQGIAYIPSFCPSLSLCQPTPNTPFTHQNAVTGHLASLGQGV
jgi:hypothetical protein